MRLLEVRLNGFGRFKELFLSFPSNFNLVIGPNEAGKSTIVDAVSGVLFGFRRGQKSLREIHRPWNADTYSASLVLSADEETRFLVGRDFEHDRLEVFRGRGVRLEPLAENEWGIILDQVLGLSTPQLFEGTLLIRQPEVGAVGRDREAVSKLAEALGRKISGGDENVPAAAALRIIREKLAYLTAREGPGTLAEIEAEAAAKEKELVQVEEGFQRYSTLLEERRRLQDGLSVLEAEQTELRGRLEAAQAAARDRESRRDRETRLREELSRVQQQLMELDKRQTAQISQKQLTEQQIEQSVAALDPPISEEVLARAADLESQIAALEAELRYERDNLGKQRTELELLEKEIAATRTKLDGLDKQLTSSELQNRIAFLLPVINEHAVKLNRLLPEADHLLARLARLETLRAAGLILSFLSGAAALAASEYLHQPQAWITAGVYGFFVLVTAAMMIATGCLRKSVKRLNEEIEQRDKELQECSAEMDRLLEGKTLSQFQAEIEAARLYRSDLWHLEQTWTKLKADMGSERAAALEQNLATARAEMAGILISTGCRTLDEMRTKAAHQARSGEESQSAEAREEPIADADPAILEELEELAARERDLRQQLADLSDLPSGNDAAELESLLGQRAQLEGQIQEVRMRLAELGAEIRNYQQYVLNRDRFEVEEELAEAQAKLAKARVIQQGLALAARRLEESVFEVQANLGPELGEMTGAYLSRITNGRYREVQIELTPASLEIRVRAPENGALVDVAQLSTGTIDQLYLALRLALARQLIHSERFPILLDDPFISFDPRRMAESIKVLAELSLEHQVIWFSKDPALVQQVRDCGGLEPNVQELPV